MRRRIQGSGKTGCYGYGPGCRSKHVDGPRGQRRRGVEGPVFEALETRRLLSAVLPADINAFSNGSNPGDMVELDGVKYFAADNGQDMGLWKTDGTEAGTVLV